MPKLSLSKPVAAYTGGTATASAYTQVVAATPAAADRIHVQNKTNKILKFAVGSAGNEVDIPFYCQSDVEGVVIPCSIGNGQRLSVKAVDADVSSGAYVINLLG